MSPFHERLNLLPVISVFRNLNASDPRDKLFAFLNIVEEKGLVAPNYRQSAQAVFRATAGAIIKGTNSLSVPSHIEDPSNRKIEDLPGWVSDFSARLETEAFDNGSDPCRYCASYINFKLTEASEIVFHPEGGLSVVGHCIDTVKAVADSRADILTSFLMLAVKRPAQYPGKPNS